MAGRGRAALAIACGAAALALGIVLLRSEPASDADPAAGEAVAARDDDAERAGVAASPFDALGSNRDEASTVPAGGAAAREAGPGVPAVDPVPAPATAIDLTAVGRAHIDDERFATLLGALSADPALVLALVDEFRSETDPDRLADLACLLGELDDPAVAGVATELVYSGDGTSRAIGLDLLRRVRPDAPEALDVVSSLLSTETGEQVLVPTLNVLAGSPDIDAAERIGLAGQVASLVGHEDPRVRRRSVDVLARWSEDPAHETVLVGALDDPDPKVRQTAAYAFVGRGDVDRRSIDRLLEVVADDAETKRTRRGAVLALRGLPIDDAERARVDAAERRLDTRSVR